MGPRKLRPAEMLRDMNQLIVERRVEGRFVTMAYATWNGRKRQLRISSAGQEQPLLYRQGKVEKLDLTGFPLGLFEDVQYDEVKLSLDPGDIVVFYSDGMSDTQDPQGEFFGWQRMMDVLAENTALPPAEIAGKMLAAVNRFSEDAPAADDRTLVILKVREPA
jgi:sigma-B regulation protein RsbU (phosphoserine phosphatase)